MLNLKKIIICICFLICFSAKKVESSNLFELTLIGLGVYFVGDQYFDNSLDNTNSFEQKAKVIDKYYESNKTFLPSKYFSSLPIQQQLLLIEEFDNF